MNIQFTIEQAKEVASRGDTITAIALLREAVRQEPRNIDAWLALAEIVEKPEQSRQCLERVLQIDPNNQIAQQKLLGEQPNELDFLFDAVDEPIQEPEDSRESVNELDFSNLYAQADQPSQSGFVQSRPAQTISEQRQTQDQVTPVMPSPVPLGEARRQRPPSGRMPAAQKPVQKKRKGLSKIEIALIGVIGFICLCLGFLGLAYIGNSGVLEPEPTSLPEEITAVIYENIRASNARDFDGYMATIHSKSPVYNTTKEGVKKAFSDEFTLSYRLSDVYVIEQSANKAKAHFVLTTRLVSGPISFRDNRVTGEMTLRKEDGVWKIYNQEVENVEYLD